MPVSLPDPPPSAPLKARLAARLSRPSLYAYLTLALALLGLLVGHRLSQTSGMAQLGAVASERLELYAASLESELARHAYLPSLIAVDEELPALLAQPDSPALQARVARKLAGINVRAGAGQTLLVDAEARVLAGSGDEPGEDKAAFEARLLRALQEGSEHFFRADSRQASTDFVQIHPLRRQGRLIGAVVVRINLAPLEATWVDLGLRSQSEKLLVLDDQDVIIMSSVPAWRYRVLGALDEARRIRLQASARYGSAQVEALGLSAELLERADTALLPAPAGSEGGSAQLLAQQRSVAPLGLRLVTLSDPSEVWRQARYAAWGGAAFGASLGLLALYLASRRRALAQLFLAKTELQHAHAQLEKLVDVRTAELRATNEELKRQIAQRLRAEDELVQAGKLAALGQMSAGISHELNQPLTALRALSRNTLLLQEGGRAQAVADNLRTIDTVVERMSLITRQLKNFARKAESAAAPVTLASAVRNVLLLLEHRMRAELVQLHLGVDERLRVQCDATRLEQVLLNLCGNALDAMQNCEERELRIEAMPVGERVRVRVGDSGHGIAPALMPRLFEPFFTTKPPGQGLGLGLVISSKIVHEAGGTLRALPGEPGMVFEFDLELAKD